MTQAPLALTLPASASADATATSLVRDRVASRLFAGDDTLWGADAQPEASVRLGWVRPTSADGSTDALLDNIDALRNEFSEAGVDRFVLSGMGGSSLAPEVITRRYGVPLFVLDSTHPARVSAALGSDLTHTALIVSSKSGSTVETQSHRETFEAAFRAQGIDPAGRIVVVTDPGSPFAASAHERGNRVFLADPTVGGRYSALTAFGLVPSGLAGADIRGLLEEASSALEALSADTPENPALRLAAEIHAGLPECYALVLAPGTGSDVSSAESSTDWGLPDWIEQLVAESTGKLGLGVLPVAVQSGSPEARGQLSPTELLLRVPPLPVAVSGARLDGSLGAQFLCWEAATAVLGRLMGINPFDQPDVESAKNATRALLGQDLVDEQSLGKLSDVPDVAIVRAPEGNIPSSGAEFWQNLAAQLPTDGYLAIQAYLATGSLLSDELTALREELTVRFGVPVTLGWGPRFLHSTGQLHKGGPGVGVFVQLTDEVDTDLSIPGSPQSYHELLTAQAAGDASVLSERGRPVTTLRLTDPVGAVVALRASLHASAGPAQ